MSKIVPLPILRSIPQTASNIVSSALMISLCALINISAAFISPAFAQSEDLGLCPSGYSQGLVSTGFVDCYDTSSSNSNREVAEADRLEIEAACNLTPNSEITNSAILVNSSDRFFASVTCTITRVIPAGTVLCPGDSQEVYRAFNTLVCKYFGNAVATMPEAQTMLTAQSSECTAVPGLILTSSIGEDSIDDTAYFFTNLECAIVTAQVDVIQCPYGFLKTGENNDILECRKNMRDYESLAEAQAANDVDQALCVDTTSGLGSVVDFQIGLTSLQLFFSEVTCEVRKPRFGDFSDQTVLRACDATCTTTIEQTRDCLNGGVIGGPGCVGPGTQEIERRCNTGPSRDGLCPLDISTPTVITPLLLLDEDE